MQDKCLNLYNAVCNNETPWEALRSQDVGFEDECIYVYPEPDPHSITETFFLSFFFILHISLWQTCSRLQAALMATPSDIQALENVACQYLTDTNFGVVEIETIMSKVFSLTITHGLEVKRLEIEKLIDLANSKLMACYSGTLESKFLTPAEDISLNQWLV